MEYRVLGRTGINVSPLGLGTDNFLDPTPADESARILNRALDAGINFIDTGDVYAEGEGERIIGKTLKESKRRHQVLIATKVDHGQRRPGLTLEEYEPELVILQALDKLTWDGDKGTRLNNDVDLAEITREGNDIGDVKLKKKQVEEILVSKGFNVTYTHGIKMVRSDTKLLDSLL